MNEEIVQEARTGISEFFSDFGPDEGRPFTIVFVGIS